MAWSDVYYKVVGDDVYYTNEEKSGYTERQGGEICTEGKHVIIELYNGKFKFPNGSAWLFYGATNTTFNDMDKWETADAGSFTGIFENCTALLSDDLDFSNFSASSSEIYSMNSMFKNCSSITELDLSALRPDNVIGDYTSMFEGCTNLRKLNLIGGSNRYDTLPGGHEPVYTNMFYNCSNLEEIDVITGTDGNYNWGHELPCEGMFYNCVKLPNYDPNERYDLERANSIYDDCYFTGIPQWYQCDVYIKEDNTWKLMEAYQ